jgi:hypothetical protein
MPAAILTVKAVSGEPPPAGSPQFAQRLAPGQRAQRPAGSARVLASARGTAEAPASRRASAGPSCAAGSGAPRGGAPAAIKAGRRSKNCRMLVAKRHLQNTLQPVSLIKLMSRSSRAKDNVHRLKLRVTAASIVVERDGLTGGDGILRVAFGPYELEGPGSEATRSRFLYQGRA